MSKEIELCEACPNVGELATFKKMRLCASCYAKELLNEPKEIKPKEVKIPEVESSNEVYTERAKRAFNEQTNEILVSGMTPEGLKQHIADLQDYIKIFQVKLQAALVIDDQWDSEATTEERAKRQIEDKKYRAKARPPMNADGTLKVRPKSDKPATIGDAGDKAFESLVEKLLRTGMDRKQAETLIRGMKK